MNKIEKSIARFLTKYPKPKRYIKYIYSNVMYVFSRRAEVIICNYPVRKISTEAETFFGYYDHCPENANGLCLVNTSHFSTKNVPAANGNIEVSVIDTAVGSVVTSEISASFNWQQGARSHWLTDNLFIFNDFCTKKNRYVSRVVDVTDMQTKRIFDFSVQYLFKGISLNR